MLSCDKIASDYHFYDQESSSLFLGSFPVATFGNGFGRKKQEAVIWQVFVDRSPVVPLSFAWLFKEESMGGNILY